MSGCDEKEKSLFWDHALTVNLSDVVYLHCHQQGKLCRLSVDVKAVMFGGRYRNFQGGGIKCQQRSMQMSIVLITKFERL